MLRRSLLLALPAVFALSACTSLYDYTGNRYPGDRYPDNRRGPVYVPSDRYEDYRRTSEYRHVDRDADRYTDLLDRELRLNGGQERSIERLLEVRAKDLLRRTHPRDHRVVYPFPRDQRMSRTAHSWWNRTDREIDRYLDRYQRDEYRHIARDLERYGRYDRRHYESSRRDRRYDSRGHRDRRGRYFNGDSDGDRDDRDGD